MLKLTRWCISHRLSVVVAWVAVAVLTTVIAGAVGRDYATNFSLPGTESQHALDLLQRDFKAQAGDVDTIVFHTSSGTVDSPAVRGVMTTVFDSVSKEPHVVSVLSPYTSRGAVEVSKNRMTAFATVNYAKPANLLPNAAGKPLLTAIDAVHMPGLQVVAEHLSSAFDTRVTVSLGKRKGKIVVEFGSVDDLQRIVELMNASKS